MPLARHVDPDQLVEKLRNSDSKAHHHRVRDRSENADLTPYSSRYNSRDAISKYRLPQQGAPVSTTLEACGAETELSTRPTLYTR